MGHHHDHHSHPSHEQFNKAFALATLLNLLFTVAEAFYAISANSMGLLADAGHNLGDVMGLVLAWGANWLLTKPANARYSYGYKRTTIFAALINALLLVATSAVIAYESIIKFFHPATIDTNIVIIVASIGILINGGTALLFMKGRHTDLNIKGAFLHLAADALISVGVVVAAIAIWFTKKVWIDPVVGLLIVILILWSTWGLLRHSIDLLLDAVPRGINRAGIEAYLNKISGVCAVHDLHIWGLSTNEVALTAHLVMPESFISDEAYLKINEDLKHDFKIDHVTIQIEQGSVLHPCGREKTC